MVPEQGLGTLQIKPGVRKVLLQQPGRLWPKWTDTLSAAFAEKLHTVGGRQSQVCRLKYADCPNACPGVEHKRQQRVITPSPDVSSICSRIVRNSPASR